MDLDSSEGVAVFTDGSADHRDRTGGWGWIAIDVFETFHTASGFRADTTISQMELYAVTNALQTLFDNLGATDVLVYSDSEYVVLGCNNRNRKRNKNKQWWEALDEAIELHSYVQFEHVRGHADSIYNHMADLLAGNARRKGK